MPGKKVINQEKLKLPQSVIQAAEEARKSYELISKNISNTISILPKIDLPDYKIPKAIKGLDTSGIPINDVMRDRDAWKRHKEILDIENSLLIIQKETLKEQKSTTKLTQWILFLTVIGIIITLILNIF